MTDYFHGEVRLFAFPFTPAGWVPCDGRTLDIGVYDALFQKIGTTFGGNGMWNFGVPDLRGRVPVHRGLHDDGWEETTYAVGESGGSEEVTLAPDQLPGHSHGMPVASMTATSRTAVGNVPAVLPSGTAYAAPPASEALVETSVTGMGGWVDPHENRQPFQALNYGILADPFQSGDPQAPFLGEVAVFPYNFVPRGWLPCDGRIMSRSQHTALGSLLKGTYGGDGVTTFALPDLRGRSALGAGQGPGLSDYALGEQGGEAEVTLVSSNIPAHRHITRAAPGGATTGSPVGTVPATGTPALYASQSTAEHELESTGGGQPHNNLQPSLALTYAIAVDGMFPYQQ